MRLLLGVLSVVAYCSACASVSWLNPQLQTGRFQSPTDPHTNPISMVEVRSISVEPVVAGGGWIELKDDGSKFVLHSTGPAGVLQPLGPCGIAKENTQALAGLLRRASQREPLREPQLGDYIVRIVAKGETFGGHILMAENPTAELQPAFVIRGNQYRLDSNELGALRKFIASARCGSIGDGIWFTGSPPSDEGDLP